LGVQALFLGPTRYQFAEFPDVRVAIRAAARYLWRKRPRESDMAKVEIYTTMFCGYCARAKSLLQRKSVAFVEMDIEAETVRRDEMIARSGGRRTVPQIFIDGEHIGGSDELAALDRTGQLDAKLGATP
jgi:glutaredoxin 3